MLARVYECVMQSMWWSVPGWEGEEVVGEWWGSGGMVAGGRGKGTRQRQWITQQHEAWGVVGKFIA